MCILCRCNCMCFVFIVPTFIAVSLVVSLLVDAFFPHKNKVLESDTRAFYGRVVPSFRGATAERFWHRRRRRRRRRPFRRYRHLSRLDRRSRRCSREATFLFGRRRARSRAISRAPSRDDVRGLPRNVRALPRRVSRGVQITRASRVVGIRKTTMHHRGGSSSIVVVVVFFGQHKTQKGGVTTQTRGRETSKSSPLPGSTTGDRLVSRDPHTRTHAREREREECRCVRTRPTTVVGASERPPSVRIERLSLSIIAFICNDFSRAKKKPTCLDDRDTNSPLDKDRDTIMPGPEERSSRPGQ